MLMWITNVLKFRTDEEARRVFDGMHLKLNDIYPPSEEGHIMIRHREIPQFTFNSIIPEPETPDGLPQKYLSKYQRVDELFPTDKSWLNWSKWRTDFWGTKFDANEAYVDGDELIFKTALSKPTSNLFLEIAKKFDVSFQSKVYDRRGIVGEETNLWVYLNNRNS